MATGPWDYRYATSEQRVLVEGAHFTPDQELRLKKRFTRELGDDFNYTLRVFPNHPRALLAMMKIAERENRDPPTGAPLRVECYFERAIRFQSDDGAVRVVYGIFLTRKNRTKEAIQQLQAAERFAPKSIDPNFHYNLGLAFFDVGDFERSLSHAHAAYAGGFPLPGLKNKLERAGKWRDAPPPKAEPVTTPPSPEPATK